MSYPLATQSDVQEKHDSSPLLRQTDEVPSLGRQGSMVLGSSRGSLNLSLCPAPAPGDDLDRCHSQFSQFLRGSVGKISCGCLPLLAEIALPIKH